MKVVKSTIKTTEHEVEGNTTVDNATVNNVNGLNLA